jgi:A/G-specific adenine glycosylase
MGKSGAASIPFKKAAKNLAVWFERQKRVLPWRDSPTLYRVWISEIMLQQTQVATVIPYFERFLEKFPDVRTLAEAPEEEVMKQWAGLGYYSRARNLQKGARTIVALGRFPENREEWEAIPGVGPYTAGAILSIALDLPEAILDGNVERVLSRWRRVSREKGDAAFKAQLWDLSEKMVGEGFKAKVRPRVLNQALMELGAMTCTFRKPKCFVCPLKESCEAHAAGEEEAFPPKKKPKQWVQVQEELHCLTDGKDRVFVRRRAEGEWRAGLWDLLEAKPKGARLLGSFESRHVVTRHKITRITHVWETFKGAAENLSGESADYRWISIESPEVAVGSALNRTLRGVWEILIRRESSLFD